MKKTCLLLLLLVGALAAGSVSAAEVAGVKLEDRVQAGQSELVLNGAGVRKKLFIKVYVAALYVPQKSAAAAALLESGPRRMVLSMLRDVEAPTLFSALRDGLKDNLEPAVLAGFQTQVDQLGALMGKIGNARTGDRIVLDLGPAGVTVSHNAVSHGTVTGGSFASALLTIWLGEHPVDKDLKQALLGG
ncbi:MAG: chalcone isomerase family protein [Rhodocyclaceae bacterium]|nr:chalcone isomerase family protein [Rhodocyclaceae bacterium]